MCSAKCDPSQVLGKGQLVMSGKTEEKAVTVEAVCTDLNGNIMNTIDYIVSGQNQLK